MTSLLKLAQQSLRRVPVVHKAIRRVWTPPQRIYQHLYFDGVFTLEVEPGTTFKLETYGSVVENDLFWTGYGNGWEGRSLRAWRELCKSASVIVDIGANSGVYALAAKALNPSARVVAIEPSKRPLAQLKRNIELNGFDIEVLEVAVSDHNGTATFYDYFESEGFNYTASLSGKFGGSNRVQVPVRRLDDLIDNADLIKIDVERHEPELLRGAKRLLESGPTLLIEVLDGECERQIREETPGYDWHMIEEDRNAVLTRR
jgi:FkbM family methyltransferase